MLRSSIPPKFPKAFAAQAGGAYIRPIPVASQIGIQDGAASLTDGFPPLTQIPVPEGGVPPFGQDVNGIINQITLWSQWQQMGGAVPYDSTFQFQIGGYPAGAVVESALALGAFFVSLVDNNLTNPDAGGAGWMPANVGAGGIVQMQFIGVPGAGGQWIVVKPDGSFLSTAGSSTQGLQEAVNYAVQNGYRFECIGQGAKLVATQSGTLNGTTIVTGLTTSALHVGDFITGNGIVPGTQITTIDGPGQVHMSSAATQSGVRTLKFANNLVFILCTTSVTVPPAEQWSCSFYNVNITFAASAANGLVFDSQIICDFEFVGGQIVYMGNGYGVVFAPTNPVVLDGFATIGANSFFISNVATPVASGSASGVVGFNCSNGGILNNSFGFLELNGAGNPFSPPTAPVGVQVFGPTAQTGFEQNLIDIAEIHEVTSAGVQIGVGVSGAGVLRQNLWRIGAIHPNGASSVGLSTFGTQDVITIGAITSEEGPLGTGVVLQSSAALNTVTVGAVVGAATVLTEAVYGSNFVSPSLRPSSYGGTKGTHVFPDGLMMKYINNAAGNTTGAVSTFDAPFPTALLSIAVTAQNVVSAFQAAGTASGVTITTGTSSGTFAVIALGR